METAYIQRQRWLAKLQAVEVARVLFGDSKGNTAQKPYRETNLDGLMSQMGTTWQ